MGKNYYLGLDIGTGSVGWAVTDEIYQIPKVHGKALWGADYLKQQVRRRNAE